MDYGSGDRIGKTDLDSGHTFAARRGSVVCLVGFMGAGKTSVGRNLGRRFGWPFDDLDERVEAREGHSIEEIFRDSGEGAFRRAETAALRELLDGVGPSSRIIALGGGAMAQPENLELLQLAEVAIVFLDGPAEELFQRCEQDQRDRPLRRDPKQFRELYDGRRAFYMKADHQVNTSGKDLDTVAVEVACSLGLENLLQP